MSTIALQSQRLTGGRHVEYLERQFGEGSLGHAYLFYGGGPTELSEVVALFAHALLCTDQDQRPCGSCAGCLLVQRGMHTDIIAVARDDNATYITVDQVREMRKQAQRMPAHGSRRVVTIELIDTLHIVAANALLKILEEPPANVIILLSARSLGSLPPTLLSRCQLVKFAPTQPPPSSLAVKDDEELLTRLRAIEKLPTGSLSEQLKVIERELSLLQTSKHGTVREVALKSVAYIDHLELALHDTVLVKSDAAQGLPQERLGAAVSIEKTLDYSDILRWLEKLADLRYTLQRNIAPLLAWEHFFITIQ